MDNALNAVTSPLQNRSMSSCKSSSWVRAAAATGNRRRRRRGSRGICYKVIRMSRARFATRGACSALLVCATLVWFDSGMEWVRRASWAELSAQPARLLWPPWNALRAYVSRDGDDRLYYEYSRLMLGEEADLAYVATRQLGDPRAALARLQGAVRAGPGGRLPYRDFPFEYPPVPLAAILLPRLFASTLPVYRAVFGALMGLCALAAALLGARLAQRLEPDGAETAARRALLYLLAFGPLLVARFDALPVLLTTGALVLVCTGRPLRGGALLGIATMAKLYPLLLLAPWLALLLARGREGLREGARLCAGTVLGAGAAALPFLLACPGPFAHSVSLYGERPFQIESLVGGALLVARGAAAVIGSFGSYNANAPEALASAWTLVLPGLLVLLAAGAYAQEKRAQSPDQASRIARLCAWTAAALACILCASKVLSPQFLLWLFPAVLVLPGRAGTRVFRWAAAAALLTQAYYPYLYEPLLDGHPAAVALLTTRNLALLALLAASAQAALRAGGQREPPPSLVTARSERN